LGVFVLLFSSSVFAQATISGQVTDANTAAPLEGIPLELRGASGNSIESVASDASDFYTLNAPGDGDYFVLTPEFGWLAPTLPEVYPDTFCNTNGCDPTSAGEAVPVAGTPVSGIDFLLENGFTFSGTVLGDSLIPVDGITICIHRRSAPFAGVCVHTTNNALPVGNDYAACVASSGLHT
jgi:hypothetical protein